MAKRNFPFRIWYYFRQGWALYFAFILAAINTLTVTYHLAIVNIPSLQSIFPTFSHYIVYAILIGIPVLILIGYVHYKKSPAYGSEQDVYMESYPYNFKLPPGYWRKVLAPTIIELLQMDLKIINKESLPEEEKAYIDTIQKKLNILKDGGYVEKPKIPW